MVPYRTLFRRLLLLLVLTVLFAVNSTAPFVTFAQDPIPQPEGSTSFPPPDSSVFAPLPATEAHTTLQNNNIAHTNPAAITPETGGGLVLDDNALSLIVDPQVVTDALDITVTPYTATKLPDTVWGAWEIRATDKSGQTVDSIAAMRLGIHTDDDLYYARKVASQKNPTLYKLTDKGEWEIVPSGYDFRSGTVSQNLTQFGIYGVGSMGGGSYGVQALPSMKGFSPDLFSGNAGYSYPLQMPPAVGGIGVNLALRYSTEGVNAIVGGDAQHVGGNTVEPFRRQASEIGWGWSLSGLGSVTHAFNEQTSNDDDELYLNLNGESYRLIRGSGITGGSLYHTDPESFLRIEAYEESDGATPNPSVPNRPYEDKVTKWVVWTHDGTRYIFGGTSYTSPAVAYNRDYSDCDQYEFREAHLTQIIDVLGNSTTISYEKELPSTFSTCSDGNKYVRAVRPTAIQYYGKSVNGVTDDYARVLFQYVSRPDVEIEGYTDTGNQLYISSKRLQNIVMQLRTAAGDNYGTSNMYTLTQDWDRFSGATSDGESIMRLTEIAPRGIGPTSPTLYPTTITYNNEGEGVDEGPNFNMVASIKNGSGATLSFEYERRADIAIDHCDAGSLTRRYYLYQSQLWNGFGSAIITDYVYTNPFAQGWGYGTAACLEDFEFGGYEIVQTAVRDENSVVYKQTTTKFYQTESGYIEQRKGHINEDYILNPGISTPVSSVLTTWGKISLSGGRVWIRKDQDIATLNGVISYKNYTYDSTYGYLTRTEEYDNSTLIRASETTYTPYIDLANNYYLIARPTESRAYDGSNTCKNKTTYTYDTTRRNLMIEERVSTQDCNSSPVLLTEYEYDAFGNQTAVEDPLSRRTETSYDTPPNNTTPGWPRTYVYPLTVKAPTIGSQQYITSLVWNKFLGQVETVTDPNNQQTNYRYDAWGRLIKMWKPGDSETSATEERFYYSYDSTPYTESLKGRPFGIDVVQKTSVASTTTTGATATHTYLFYDGLGREMQTRSIYYNNGVEDAVVNLIRYNALGAAAKVYVPLDDQPRTGMFYLSDQPQSGTNPWATYPATQTTYDALGRALLITAPDSTTTTHTYSKDGTNNLLVHRITDARNNYSDYLTDGLGRQRKVKDLNASATTTYSYDYRDLLTYVEDAAGNDTYITYNTLGQKIQITDPDTTHNLFRYNAVGNLVKEQNMNDIAICYLYDAHNRMLGKRAYTGIVDATALDALTCPTQQSQYQMRYFYDEVRTNSYNIGQRTTMQDYADDLTTLMGSTQWDYDTRGRTIRETKTIASSTFGSYVTQWTYDTVDRVRTLTYPTLSSGGLGSATETITYNYGGGRQTYLNSITGNATHGNPTYLSQRSYNRYGQLIEQKLGTTIYQKWQYWFMSESLGRLKAIQAGTTAGGTNLQNVWFETEQGTTPGYDAVGNVLAIKDKNLPYYHTGDPVGTTRPSIMVFSYDSANRLTYNRVNGPSGSGTYSPETYNYNAIGNITSIAISGGATYTYGYGNQASSCPTGATARPHTAVSDGQRSYCYDWSGKMTRRTNGSVVDNYVYDKYGRLVEVQRNGVPVARYQYDADNNRVRSEFGDDLSLTAGQESAIPEVAATEQGAAGAGTDDSVAASAITYHVGPHFEIRSNKPIKYYSAEGQTFAIREGGSVSTLYYRLADHLGSSSITLDTSGVEVGETRYKPWGVSRYSNGDMHTQRQFTGQYNDADVGLYYYNARYYDPALQRFIQPDSMVPNPSNPQSFNRYSYVLNNPVRYTDPLGFYEDDAIKTYLQDTYGDNWQSYWDAWQADPYWMWLLHEAEDGSELHYNGPAGAGEVTFGHKAGSFTLSSGKLHNYQGKGAYKLFDAANNPIPDTQWVGYGLKSGTIGTEIGPAIQGGYYQPVFNYTSGKPVFLGWQNVQVGWRREVTNVLEWGDAVPFAADAGLWISEKAGWARVHPVLGAGVAVWTLVTVYDSVSTNYAEIVTVSPLWLPDAGAPGGNPTARPLWQMYPNPNGLGYPGIPQ